MEDATTYFEQLKKEEYMMKGNEKDCICAHENSKHSKRCDAYRLSEFKKKAASIIMQKEEWEEEFDERFSEYKLYFEREGREYVANTTMIKSFIHKLLQEKGEEIVGEIAFIRKVDDVNKGGGQYGHPETDMDTGYNQAISDAISIIKRIMQ